MIHLEVVDGQDKGRALETRADLVRIGRAEENELVLPDWHVSGEHAQLLLAGDRWVVRDLQSTNGTRILRGEERLDLAAVEGRESALASGDVLLLGDDERPVKVLVTIDEDPDDARIVSVRKVAELGEVEKDIGADSEVLKTLYVAQKEIGATLELGGLLDVVAQQVFRFLPRATHVTVALREEDDPGTRRGAGRYVPIGTKVRGGAGRDAVPITRSVFRKVVAERAAVLAADARRDVGETASIMGAQIQSTIGVPLWAGDDIIGVLQVDNRDQAGIFRERDLDVLALLAQSASQAFRHARVYQRLQIAEEKERKENLYLKKREQSRREGAIIGEAGSMRRLFEQLRKVVNTRVTVLIEGETGTGKELIASAVHYWSDRRERLFVAQNCAAMPENLLESELFGHKKGSFTGATDDKKGLFELADGGTLFLDEVGEMPLNLQAKLLRALQEGEIRPVGAAKTIKVDTRIVAATNRDLEKEVAEGRFREDLFYRLKVFPIRVPPLRERHEDIPLISAHFLRKYCQEFGRSISGFSQQAMEMLQAYKWPGNVRELENEVQRLVIQVDDEAFVQPEHLSPKIRQVENILDRVHPTKGTLKEMVEQVEKWILLEALKEHGNNKSQTAKTLGITREGLHKKLKHFGIS
ncbi:sigma-54-dependent Fis family transcriptional regulator [Sandaracinus amylolyticus]|uniref:Response regulator of zinc sigma-54-dependent two-component system n=1 Tax=Sandaracinus amylolyticus TaxID=927083 RepID=A0A0F6W5C7_9BACT|nr:sigma-54-dependent Fis family transcriptional regulator [Sandaracinus amylolyticus]AKF07893.1 Response regulator of zinc sigma-54-dependent two-component system [Sandaracinus amylolyticus]